jgi:glycosyltransferase involved in cell wall biosynthesis
MRYEDVAVLIPCLNEERTIGKVVRDFSAALPGARILVFDNASSDGTALTAQRSGAAVIHAHRRGKGNVVKQMFEQVDAALYVLVDGDDTYPAPDAQRLIAEFRKGGVDMVVGARIAPDGVAAYRRFHRFGNRLISALIARLFSIEVTDVLSGYRVLSREFVKSVPLASSGFEIETELTLQAAAKGLASRELPIEYRPRPHGSVSKLNTFADGLVVLKAIVTIFKDYKPLLFFSGLSVALALASLAVGARAILGYLDTGLVHHLPSALLATGTAILAALSLCIGLILDTLAKYHNENIQLFRRLMKK